MHNKSAAALFGGISLAALATSAMAQASGGAVTPVADVESVVVTASRIQSNGFSAPTPVTVVLAEDLLKTTPSNIPDALNKLPQFANSGITVGGSSGPGTIYTGNFLNLRSMGASRTLLLLDGRRVVPTSAIGTVDTNTLPQMLVQRVDVVTGGASAVYGSDAVTGVVNYVLNRRYTGFKVEAQTGISDRGDVPSTKVGLAAGVNVFGGRGHLIFSAEHSQNAGLKTVEARPWFAPIYVYTGDGTAQSPNVLTANARLSQWGYGGLVTSGPFRGQQFVGSGTLAAFNPGTPTTSPTVSSGGDGTYLYNAVMRAPLRNDQVFGRFEYELADNVVGYMQLGWNESGADHYHRSNTPGSSLTIFSGNPFLPASAQAQLTATNTASFVMNRYVRDLTLPSYLRQTVNTLNFSTGLSGRIQDNFNWEAYYTHGEAKVRSHRTDNVNWQHFYAALDAVRAPNGQIVCRVDLTNPGLYPGCKPLNMFGELNESQDALNYVYGDNNFEVANKLDNFAASISGDVWQGWAGPLSTAFNFEYRQQSMVQASTIDGNAAVDLTGIRFGALPRSAWIFDLLTPQKGHNSVWEVNGEAAMPLIVDAPFAKRLDVTGAVRYTQYSTSGPATTWKLGLNYSPVEELRLRYTESRDIRAPSLFDLYAANTVVGQAFNDVLTGRSGNVLLKGGGNPDLVPEVSRMSTFGGVYRPSWLPSFQMSVDYFNMRIANGITSLSGASAAVLNECNLSGGTSPLCLLVERPLGPTDKSAANFPTAVRSTLVNVAAEHTHGVDVEVSYNFKLASLVPSLPGKVDLRLLYTYQPVQETQAFASSAVVNNAGTVNLADHRGSLTVGYDAGPFSVRWQARYQGAVVQTNNAALIYAQPNFPSHITHDLNVAYDFKAAGHTGQAYVTVSNVFDTAPRIVGGAAATPGNMPSTAGDDDYIGRYYTFGLRFKY